MEECEALCTRMAIMVNGKFKCLGSSQHLKTKFGNGYTIMARMAATESDEDPMAVFSEVSVNDLQHSPKLHGLIRFIEDNFPGAELKDEHQGMIHYWIPEVMASGGFTASGGTSASTGTGGSSSAVTWAEIFEKMEMVKNEFGVEDYSVSQTTLEQIFLIFARGQNEENK